MKLNWELIWRFPWCVVTATAYQIATNPFVLAALLAIGGYWQIAAGLVLGWFALCLLAVAVSRDRFSVIANGVVFTTPSWLFLLGNAQEGNAPDWYRVRHLKWPRWLCALVFMSWRNKLRNLPFVPGLAWLHKPDPASLPIFDLWNVGGVRIELWWRGWMTELKASKGKWFLDIGPRLDQPDAWGGCSWAFRPAGRVP